MKTLKLSIKQQSNRIEKIYLQATNLERVNGLNWYNDANVWSKKIACLYGLNSVQISQLISLLSPQKKWSQNKKDVIDLIEGKIDSIFSCKRTLKECNEVINGNFTIPKNRLKTYSFAKCIEFNGLIDLVVIDRHAIKIAFGQMSSNEIGITIKRYKDAASAYKLTAKKYGMSAAQMQAITWVTYKRIVNR
jgi:hypothetical protein